MQLTMTVPTIILLTVTPDSASAATASLAIENISRVDMPPLDGRKLVNLVLPSRKKNIRKEMRSMLTDY